MYLRFNNLLAPPDDKGSAGVITPGELSKEDIIEFLAEDDKEDEKPIELKDDKKKEDKEEEKELESKDKEVEETETDELKEIEEELEEPDEEKLELVTPVRRAEILKKYPTLFKDFPYLEKAYYREQQFTEIFPTIPDAKEALDKADTLDKLEKDLMDGNTNKVLLAIKNENPKSFARVVDNYLSTLSEIDEKAYHHVVGNVIKHTIIAMVKEGRASQNEKIQEAAQLINQFVFGSSEFIPPSLLSKVEKEEDNTKEKELQRERQQFTKQRFESSRDELDDRVNNILTKTIDLNIDPKDSMGPYVKEAASKKALDTLTDLIDRDTRFKTILDKLWENSFKDNFSKLSLDRIKGAYISKAKSLLPSVIKKARIEALKGIGKRVRDDSSEREEQEQEESTTKRESTSPLRRESGHKGKITSARDIPSGMTTKEFLDLD